MVGTNEPVVAWCVLLVGPFLAYLTLDPFPRDLLFKKGSPHTRQGYVSSSLSLLSGVACFFVLRFFPDAVRTAVVFCLFWTSSFSTKLILYGDDVRHAADSAFSVRALGASIHGEGRCRRSSEI